MNYHKKTINDVDVPARRFSCAAISMFPRTRRPAPSPATSASSRALPTIRALLWTRGAAVIACSHLGKPAATLESFERQLEKGKAPEEITEDAWLKPLKKLSPGPRGGASSRSCWARRCMIAQGRRRSRRRSG